MLIAADTGATVRMAEFDTTTGRLETAAVAELCNARTRWVAVTGASNAIGTMPDIAAITAAAHEVGAKVVVDGVHLTPHAACRSCRDRLRRVLDVVVQVVRPARRHHLGRARAARPVAGLQGAPFASHRPRAAAARHAGLRIVGRHRGRRTVPARRRHDQTRRSRTSAVHLAARRAAGDAERPRARPARHGRPSADARVPRRRPHPATKSPEPWPPARSPSGTATTTPSR